MCVEFPREFIDWTNRGVRRLFDRKNYCLGIAIVYELDAECGDAFCFSINKYTNPRVSPAFLLLPSPSCKRFRRVDNKTKKKFGHHCSGIRWRDVVGRSVCGARGVKGDKKKKAFTLFFLFFFIRLFLFFERKHFKLGKYTYIIYICVYTHLHASNVYERRDVSGFHPACRR